MINFTMQLTGTGPGMLMHNARLSNPLDPFAKGLSEAVKAQKKAQTDATFEDVCKIEWMGGLYCNQDEGPYLPTENIKQSIVGAGRMVRLGKAVQGAVIFDEDIAPLQYTGPRTPDELYAAGFVAMHSVKVGTSRVMRARPHFKDWSVTVSGILDEKTLDPDTFVELATKAGSVIGVCDWRPRYGRFNVEVAL